MLTLTNACKHFGLNPVLNNINLTIKQHTILGLAGPSGGGKSTLLRCIQGLDILSSGTLVVKGKSGFMFQDFQLFPHMTVLNNLIYAPNLQNKSLKHTENAQILLNTLGIADKAPFFPHQLSGGQRQRVALARSLMMKPALLLCDEPTSGLDLVMIEEVIALLNAVKAMGVTMVIASHDLAFLAQIADRVIILKGGQFVTDINPADFKKPIDYLKQQLSGENYDPNY